MLPAIGVASDGDRNYGNDTMIVRDATTSINVPTSGDSNDKERGFRNADMHTVIVKPPSCKTAGRKQ